MPSLSIERKKKEKKKEERKTFMLETVCRENIAPPPHRKYLLGPQLLKFWLYFKCPLVEIYLLCYLPSKLPSFAYFLFSFISLQFILAKCPIRL